MVLDFAPPTRRQVILEKAPDPEAALTPALLQTIPTSAVWEVRVTFHFTSQSPTVVHIIFSESQEKLPFGVQYVRNNSKQSRNSPPDSSTAAQTEQSCQIFYWLESLMWLLVWRSSCAAVYCNTFDMFNKFFLLKDIHIMCKSLKKHCMLILDSYDDVTHKVQHSAAISQTLHRGYPPLGPG